MFVELQSLFSLTYMRENFSKGSCGYAICANGVQFLVLCFIRIIWWQKFGPLMCLSILQTEVAADNYVMFSCLFGDKCCKMGKRKFTCVVQKNEKYAVQSLYSCFDTAQRHSSFMFTWNRMSAEHLLDCITATSQFCHCSCSRPRFFAITACATKDTSTNLDTSTHE